MTTTNRWLLPDGVEEVLPSRARSIESTRRQLLDLYHSKGYELVMPPLIEYTDSLLIGLGQDMDLHSFKMADQLSGRLLAVRPDITPQVARIDAHSLAREGVTRYCYAGSVLHTVPLTPSSSRSPYQLGAELYGEASVEADVEVIELMLASLQLANMTGICLDLGHVGIYSAMLKASGLNGAAQEAVFDALQRKAQGDLQEALATSGIDSVWQKRFIALVTITGDEQVLNQLTSLFDVLPIAVEVAIDQCKQVVGAVKSRFEDVSVFFDFTELRGYHYHTGLVFAAYVDGVGQAVANGGRYDDIGEVFGRARPATGFSTSLDILCANIIADKQQCVFVPFELRIEASAEIKSLRARGLAVIEAFKGDMPPLNCTHLLQRDSGDSWALKTI